MVRINKGNQLSGATCQSDHWRHTYHFTNRNMLEWKPTQMSIFEPLANRMLMLVQISRRKTWISSLYVKIDQLYLVVTGWNSFVWNWHEIKFIRKSVSTCESQVQEILKKPEMGKFTGKYVRYHLSCVLRWRNIWKE